MKRFLAKLALGMLSTFIGFVAIAITARFVPSVNWFFFQKNEHDRVFYTLLSIEKVLAQGQHFDVLVFGSSTCENALDPELFGDLTGLSVFKFVTGAQTIDMSAILAKYCVPIMKPKYVIIDAYPRYGTNLTEEGVERAVINSPDATSPLTRTILSADPHSFTTRYLWAARAIGTALEPYDAHSIVLKPGEFEMIAPGYTRTVNDPPAIPNPFLATPLPKDAVHCLNTLRKELAATGQELVTIIPPLQNMVIYLEDTLMVPTIRPYSRPDTCFMDGRHLRGVCTRPYTIELAERFNAWRAAPQSLPEKTFPF